MPTSSDAGPAQGGPGDLRATRQGQRAGVREDRRQACRAVLAAQDADDRHRHSADPSQRPGRSSPGRFSLSGRSMDSDTTTHAAPGGAGGTDPSRSQTRPTRVNRPGRCQFRLSRENSHESSHVSSSRRCRACLVVSQSHAWALVGQEPKRVGLIGSGWYGKCDLWRLIQVAPVEVVSLVRCRQEDARRGRRAGCHPPGFEEEAADLQRLSHDAGRERSGHRPASPRPTTGTPCP